MGSLLLLRRRYAELLNNPGFETAGAGDPDYFGSWSESAGDGAIARTTIAGEFRLGAAAAKLTGGATPSNTPVVSQGLAVVPGQTYILILWTRGDGTNAGRYEIYNSTALATITGTLSTGVTGTSYAPVAKAWIAPAGCFAASVVLRAPSVNTGVACFDDVSLKRK